MFISGSEVLEMLCPAGGWILVGNSFEGITWVDDRPRCTKAQFDAGFAKVEAYKLEQETAKENAKSALLAKLGITAEEAALLLS
jgi:hypothetical protein